ncbi:MAG TPA: PRC-barrel domain-containing protein [Puia sp.]|nr:PRC-barrel domain-containing protein [Puia sp.]
MLRNIKDLLGFRIAAKDDEIGLVKDFYFDDETWTIRYLIVKTGPWFSREVLLSPEIVIDHKWDTGTLHVGITMEQVRHSPDIDTQKPVSRQQEAELAKYYPWQSYWGTGFYPGGVWGIVESSPRSDPNRIRKTDTTEISHEDKHLRSMKEVTGYRIHAQDGDIGHVTDFIFDDQTWQIAYFMVDTHRWIGGKKVLIAIKHVKHVEWENSKVVVDLNVDAIKTSEPVDKCNYIVPGYDQAEYKKQVVHFK